MDFTAFQPTNGAFTLVLQFFQFKAANFSLNVQVLDIVSPSTKDIHSRFNPVCGNPKIVIKNLGSTTLPPLILSMKWKAEQQKHMPGQEI